MARPLFHRTTDDLKAMVDRNSANAAELKLVMSELRHRNTPSAKALAKKVEKLLQAGTVKPAATKAKTMPARAKASRPQNVIHLPDESGLTRAPQMSTATPEPQSTSTEPKPMTEEQRRTEAEVAALRTRLIDLGKRNPLIAFKHGGRSTNHIRIVDERPDLLLEALEEGPLGFEPLPDEEVTPKDELTPEFRIAYERARLTDPAFLEATEKLGEDEADMRAWQTAERALRHTVRQQLGLPKLDYGKSLDVKALAAAHGFDPSFDLRGSDDDDVEDHHEDDRIRVLLTAKELEKRLKGIYEKYRTHERETGLHTLFLCLGFVQWYEDDESDIQHHAPVLILPVRLEQKVVRSRYEYTLVAGDEGLEVNVALQEKMRQHWGLETPALRENETPESYFIRLKAVLDQGRRLTLRRFATIAVLPFPRMVLWKDLDPAIWSDGAFANHALLPGLLSARSFADDPTPLEAPDIDAEPLASTAPPLIQPADASQHAALIDVAAGKSLAIEGPPGTGKSQTITNMIATALRDGKRVLFVAEKQAALSVVASRLRKAGFGPLLLELHGDTAKRDTVYAGLRERFDARPSVDQARLDQARAELARKRDLIRRYLALIAEPLGRLGRSAYQLAWREIRLRKSLPASVEVIADRWTPDKVSELEATVLKERRSALDDFGRALIALRSDGGGTRWQGAERLDPFDQRSELAAARAAAAAAAELVVIDRHLAALGLSLPPPTSDLAEAVRQLAALGLPDTVDDAVLRSALRHPEAARALLDAAIRWRTLRQQLDQDVRAPAEVHAAQVDALAEALGEGDAPDSVAQARERLAALREAKSALRVTGDDLTRLAQLVSLPEMLTTTGARVAAEVIGVLGRLPSIPAALAAPAMLDPMARAALEREATAAESICAERDALAAVLNPEAFESDPGELGATADTVEQAGFFARLFNGEFKAADRRLKRWVRGGQERAAAVETLRRAARHLRRETVFRQESAAKSLFPALLWTGADSAFGAALEVATALQEAQARLRDCRAGDVLDAWLKLDAADRTRAGDLARAAAEALAKAEALGTGSVPWRTLGEAIDAKRAAAERLDAALGEVGARADGMIRREGVDLAARLRNLAAAEAIFAEILRGDGFEWVRSIDQDLSPLTDALGCAAKLSAGAGPLPIAALARAADGPATLLRELIALAPRASAAGSAWSDACATLRSRTGLDATWFESSWAALSDALATLAADQDGVRAVADLLKYRASVREAGLDPLAQAALASEVAPELLPDLYEWLVVQALVRAYVGGSGEELGRLGGLALDSARRAFAVIDEELQQLEAKSIVATRLGDKAPWGNDKGRAGDFTEGALIERELGLKRSRTSLRDLTYRAANALQALKPVWMMSPTSAAQYIRPNSITFDLLVIDEASQMRPEFAVSAILRAGQIVVVGDANQLPPSDFFAANLIDGDGDGDDGSATEDTESILDLANQRLRRKRRLRWHYRSQHERLIQYSNREFYDRDLIVFPSPTTDDELLGVKCHYVGGTYDASINLQEAQAVIEEAYRLMRAYPERSLGIATMNIKQAELIRAEFDRLMLEQREVRDYIEYHSGGIDEFFIKNLENVQGDERDIILISTVYGPNKDGVVMQRFGPMNQQVGWRRLNVLVTRAKLSTRIFTSLRPGDIKITETSSRGVVALKSYLTYAMGGATVDGDADGTPDSDFEVFVADRLRAHGYEVVSQVGVEGFRIDLGVRHPDYPLGFIAGVECDGARWHSGLSVRDRDRIRQTVLENMGWRIHRIWSTDWFANPDRELAKLLQKLEDWRAKAAADYAARPRTEPSPEDLDPAEELVELAPAPAPTPIQPAPEPAPEAEAELCAQAIQTEVEPEEAPFGKQMRSLDGIEWVELTPGKRYAVLLDDERAGTVDVISRAMTAPRVYGGAIAVARSEFEGWVKKTGERFRMHDIYATVREVARRARAAED